jgi:hypothetical protein
MNSIEPDIIELLRSRPSGRNHATESCPSETETAAFVDGTLAEAKRGAVITHLPDCSECLNLVSALARVRTQEASAVSENLLAAALGFRSKQVQSKRAPWLRWQIALPAAAALVLLVSLPPVRQNRSSELPTTEATSMTDSMDRAVRAPSSELPSDLGSLEIFSPLEGSIANPKRLEIRWSETRGGIFYEVEILRDNGDLVWKGRTEETSIRLPANEELQHGEYFVWIRTYLPDGKTLKSPAVGFRVAAGR